MSNTTVFSRLIDSLDAMGGQAEALEAVIRKAVKQQTEDAYYHGKPSGSEFFVEDSAPHCRPLNSYQKEGVRWLLSLHRYGINGVLADEMGLGKTVQVITFISALMKKGIFGTFLVCAPLSTLMNWKSEIHRWCPLLQVEVYQGDATARTKLRHRIRRRHRRAFEAQERVKQCWAAGEVAAVAAMVGGVVLCSYEAVLAEKGLLARLLHWDAIIVDEAHRLKNMNCRLIQLLKKAECGMRLIVTGTPVQNNVTEMWTLLEFIAPQLFAMDGLQEDLTELYQRWSSEALSPSGKRNREGETAPRSDSSTELHGILERLQQALSPFVLRRTKTSVGLSLPPKRDGVVPLRMTAVQQECYETVSKSPSYANGRLTHLRKCCIHPFLCKDWKTEWVRSPPAEQLRRLLSYSTKFQWLDAILPLLHRKGNRVLLFSQMTSVLDLVEEYLSLKEAYDGEVYSFVRLDGTTTVEDRVKSIELFQSGRENTPTPQRKRRVESAAYNFENGIEGDDIVFGERNAERAIESTVSPLREVEVNSTPNASKDKKDTTAPFLFLISTRAGGTGLTLTAADTVILLDADFNPHNDRQAVDRCHRIGQRRAVLVLRLLCLATVEEKQLSTVQHKIKLEKALLKTSQLDQSSRRVVESTCDSYGDLYVFYSDDGTLCQQKLSEEMDLSSLECCLDQPVLDQLTTR